MTGNFLPYDHPLMRCVRQRVELLFTRIHPALLLNYDQLWKLSARGSSWKYWKEDETGMKPRGPRGRFVKQPSSPGTAADASRKRLRQAPVHDPVSNARLPHTLCTSTWSDGTPGPLLSVWKEGTISHATIQKLNTRYAGRMLVVVTRSDTHFMNGELTVRYLEELVGPALRAKRASLNLDATARAGLIADAFTGNSAAEQQNLRDRWCKENNVEMMGNIPGGWSKNGQPCDKFHAMFRRLTDIWEDVALMYQPNIMNRAWLHDMLRGPNSTARKSLTAEDSLACIYIVIPWCHTWRLPVNM